MNKFYTEIKNTQIYDKELQLDLIKEVAVEYECIIEEKNKYLKITGNQNSIKSVNVICRTNGVMGYNTNAE